MWTIYKMLPRKKLNCWSEAVSKILEDTHTHTHTYTHPFLKLPWGLCTGKPIASWKCINIPNLLDIIAQASLPYTCLEHFFFFLMFIFERERESVSRGGAEREGDTESEAGSSLWAVRTEPNVGLELMNHEVMTWAKVGCLTDWAPSGSPVSSYISLHLGGII